jgi:hypothetical protein
LLKPGVEGVAVAGGEPPDRDVAERRDELVVDDALPVSVGGWGQGSGDDELLEQGGDGGGGPAVEIAASFHEEALQRSVRFGLAVVAQPEALLSRMGSAPKRTRS